MTIADRLHTSWQLLQHSLRIIRDNPRLLLFPVVSTLCGFMLALFFILPVPFVLAGGVSVSAWFSPETWRGVNGQEIGEQIGRLFYVYGVVIYLVSMFVATFFNVAFYNEIMRALAGQPVSVRGGLTFALSRVWSILMWSLLAATVGLIIRMIEERLGWLGRIVMGLIGVVWSVAAVFAIPVIIRRGDTNPLTVLRDSAMTLKKTWGESLAGFVGIRLGGVAFIALTVPCAIVAVVALVLLQQVWLAVVMGGLWLLAVMAMAFVLAMATHVYRCALYVYASEGVVPGPYTAELMDAGWKIKRGEEVRL